MLAALRKQNFEYKKINNSVECTPFQNGWEHIKLQDIFCILK